MFRVLVFRRSGVPAFRRCVFQYKPNLVTVKGKVVTVKDPVIVGERKLKLAEAVFADASGSFSLDIWEAMIDTIKEGNWYCLSNVQVRLW